MAIKSLKDVAKCLGLTSDNNASLKDQFLAELKSIKSALINTATSIVTDIANDLTSQFTDAVSTLKNEISAIKSAAISLKDTLSSLSVDGIIDSVCTESTEASASAPKTDPVSKGFALPQSNNDTVNTISEVAKIKAAETIAETKDITDIATIIGKVDTQITKAGINESRQLRRLYKNKHPLLKSYTKKLEGFKDVSESVGSWILGNTIDKPSLQLKNWKTTTPTCIRKNLQGKLRNELLSVIETSYDGLNAALVRNISNEFTNAAIEDVPYNTAHAYHSVGDELFQIDHMYEGTFLYEKYAESVSTQLGPRIKVVNYLVPITPTDTVENNAYTITVEGQTVPVDLRNNLAIEPFTTVNNDVLTPKELNDE